MAWYKIHYAHDACGTSWHDEWSCACNDRCPACNEEIEPVDYTDVSIIVKVDAEVGEWLVLHSPPDATDEPRYSEVRFKAKRQALRFIVREVRLAAFAGQSGL